MARELVLAFLDEEKADIIERYMLIGDYHPHFAGKQNFILGTDLRDLVAAGTLEGIIDVGLDSGVDKWVAKEVKAASSAEKGNFKGATK